MPITSFKQFLDFLKFSFLMPFRLGWSIIGIVFFGLLLLTFMYLFGYMANIAQEFFNHNSQVYLGHPSLSYIGTTFAILFTQEFIWQLWLSLIFMSAIVKEMGRGPILDSVKGLVKKHFQAILSLAASLAWLFVLLPVATISLEYRTLSYNFHYYIFFAIGVLFVFSLIEIIQNDKGLFDALADSIRLLKGRYVFTFLVLFVLTVSMHNIYSLGNIAYKWIYSDFYNNILVFTEGKVSTFFNKMAIILGAFKAVISFLIMSVYYGAVIYLYKLYSGQNSEKSA